MNYRRCPVLGVHYTQSFSDDPDARRCETERRANNVKNLAAEQLTSNDVIDLYNQDYVLHHIDGARLFDRENRRFFLRPAPQYVLERHGPRVGQTVLDLGCGGGELVPYLAAAGATVFALDFSNDAVEIAQSLIKKFPVSLQERVCVDRGDVKSLPYPDRFFDKVYSLDVLEHINDDELREMLREVGRVLKRDGRLIFTTPNVRKQSVIEEQKRRIQEPEHFTDRMHIGLRTSAQLRRMIEEEGFGVRFRYCPTLYIARQTNREGVVSRALFAAYSFLGQRLGLSWFGGDQVGICWDRRRGRHFLGSEVVGDRVQFADTVVRWLLRRTR